MLPVGATEKSPLTGFTHQTINLLRTNLDIQEVVSVTGTCIACILTPRRRSRASTAEPARRPARLAVYELQKVRQHARINQVVLACLTFAIVVIRFLVIRCLLGHRILPAGGDAIFRPGDLQW